MEVYQINIRSEYVAILKNLAAREGCSIESMIELMLEEKISEIQPSQPEDR